MKEKLAKLVLYKNTPFLNQAISIKFDDQVDTDNFIDAHYTKIEFENPYNILINRFQFELRMNVNDASLYNFGYYQYQNKRRYYFTIENYEWLNDDTTRITILDDVLLTYNDGQKISDAVGNVMIERQHVKSDVLLENRYKITHNSDNFNLSSNMENIISWFFDFTQETRYVIFQTSVDLESDFGTADNPKMKTSFGNTYDQVTSPTNIYIATYDEFNNLVGYLSDFPWIAQNIISNTIVPDLFVDKSDFVDADIKNFNGQVFKFAYNAESNSIVQNVFVTWRQLLKKLNLKENNESILYLRDNYVNVTINNYLGQQINVDLSEVAFNNLDDSIFTLVFKIILGYKNQIKIYVENYNSFVEDAQYDIYKGELFNDSMIFDNLDSLPVLIDNYKLNQANTAHQRELAQSRLITNRGKSLMDNLKSGFSGNGFGDLKQNIYNAYGIFNSVKSLGSSLNSEYEYYQNLKAQQDDAKISAPSLSSQSNDYAFNFSNNLFGVMIKIKAPLDSFDQIVKTHKNIAWALNDYRKIGTLNNMTQFTYLKTGSIDNIDLIDEPQFFVELIKARLENGIKFYLNPTVSDFQNMDVMNNDSL